MAKSKMGSMLESLNQKLSSGSLSKSRQKKLLKMRARLRKDIRAGTSFVSGGLPSLGKRR